MEKKREQYEENNMQKIRRTKDEKKKINKRIQKLKQHERVDDLEGIKEMGYQFSLFLQFRELAAMKAGEQGTY